MHSKLVTPAQAASLIKDGMVVSVSSSSGLGCPDLMLRAIGERFDREGHPRDLTTLHPIAAGDMSGIKGVDYIAKKGLLKKIIGGSYPSGPSSAEPPLIWQMIGNEEVAAYNVPSGIMFDIHREAAAKRPGVLTKIGLDTFVDPDRQGCAMNQKAAAEPIVKKIVFEGEDWLYFPAIAPAGRDHPRHHRRRARQPHLRARGRLSRRPRPGARRPQQWRHRHRAGEARHQGRLAAPARRARARHAGRLYRRRSRPEADDADALRSRHLG